MLKRSNYWILLLLALAISACTASTQPPPTSAPTIIVELTSPPVTRDVPLTEANLPRVSVEAARAALDSGAAVIVDVRNTQSFVAGHIAGALSIPLTRIEDNPKSVRLDKNQWIITYCA